MRLLAGSIAAAAIGLTAVPSAACSCRCPADAETLLRQTPILFRGAPTGGSAAGAVRRYAFEVRAVYKGTAPDRIVVATPAESAACGVRFELGQEVLVGAFPGNGEVRANNCTQFCIGQRREEVERLLERCKPGAPCPPGG